MKRIVALITAFILLICLGCAYEESPAEIVATTLPVYEFTALICHGTPLQIQLLITEEISCLHDYTLTVRQMRAIEAADFIVISGAGLESFLDEILPSNKKIIDASTGIELLCSSHVHTHNSVEELNHHHDKDPHIWLSPINARIMAENIYLELCSAYPQYKDLFTQNYSLLSDDIDTLANYADRSLSQLTCRELITFHDGFSYMANAFDLTILHSIEEESGSEASAMELIQLCNIVEQNTLPAIFTETHGSTAAATVISEETGAKVYSLSMIMSGDSYFTAMYSNIDTLKEALE